MRMRSWISIRPPLDLYLAKGVVFSGIDIPGNSERLRECLADLVVDQQITTATIEEIKREIHRHYQSEGYPFVQVFAAAGCDR